MTDTWYYITYDTRRGPVDTQTLQQMVREGLLRPQHNVWKSPMPDWVPAGEVPELFAQYHRPPSAPPPPIPGAPPGGLAPLVEPVGLTTFGDEYSEGLVWRDGKILVMRKDAMLPLRCVKTNEPVEKLTVKNMAWHPPWVLALLLVGLVPCIIVLVCVQKKARIQIGFSKSAISTRRKAIAVGWLGFLAGIALFFAGAVVSGWVAAFGLLVFLVTSIYACIRCRLVSPQRIDDQYVYLKGCGPAYLDAFPILTR